jgi:hypothetical protein
MVTEDNRITEKGAALICEAVKIQPKITELGLGGITAQITHFKEINSVTRVFSTFAAC